nr:alpha/beta fold hydrolase [Nanchangia anserum]
MRSRDAVILLHGFPQFWWSWRHVLAELADSDRRIVAVDLRGCGGSDRPPTGYDLLTLSRDVVGVATAVGASRIVVAGAGIGGALAWMIPHLAPDVVQAIVPICAPHPLEVRSHPAGLLTRAAVSYGYFQVPVLAARTLRSGRLIRTLLRRWTGRDNRAVMLEEADRYAAVLQAPFAAECALRPLRELRYLSRAQRRLLRRPVLCPVWSVRGAADRVLPPTAYAHDAMHSAAPLTQLVIPRAGHFIAEEAPATLATQLSEVADAAFASPGADGHN